MFLPVHMMADLHDLIAVSQNIFYEKCDKHNMKSRYSKGDNNNIMP